MDRISLGPAKNRVKMLVKKFLFKGKVCVFPSLINGVKCTEKDSGISWQGLKTLQKNKRLLELPGNSLHVHMDLPSYLTSFFFINTNFSYRKCFINLKLTKEQNRNKISYSATAQQ